VNGLQPFVLAASRLSMLIPIQPLFTFIFEAGLIFYFLISRDNFLRLVCSSLTWAGIAQMANTSSRLPLVAPIQRQSTQGSSNTAAPQRYQGPEELLAPPRRYSTMNGKYNEQREQLRSKIQTKEHETDSLPIRTKVEQSDSYSKSPWARKILLCLGTYCTELHFRNLKL